MPLLAALSFAVAAPDVTIERATVPATGRQESVVTVARYGRYSLSATSPQGTAVQLVDRMAGPGAVHGVPGTSNGRADVFLDRGTYKLVAVSHAEGTGEARLGARPFAELNGEKPPLLPPLREVEATLADLQQRSWWVEVDGPLYVEIVGRSLADVRLWREGKWLDATVPACETVEPVEGRPQTACRVAADPEPGLYQLVAYGGPAQPWADGDGGQPLWARVGVPPLPSALRETRVLGPGGVDRFFVAAGADTVRVELPEARPVDVTVRAWEGGSPFAPGGATGRITKESLPPAANVPVSPGKPLLVTIRGAAGQAYVLQTFKSVGRAVPLVGDGTYFLTTLHGASPGDEPDATGVVVDDATGEAVAWQAIPLAAPGYRRRFNLLGPATMLLEAKEAGAWEISTAGPKARFRVEPFLVTTPKGYVAPEPIAGAGRVDVGPGLWKLTLLPDDNGIVELTMRPAGWADRAKDAVGLADGVPERAPLAAVQFPALALVKGKKRSLYLGEQPGVRVGYALRALPVDLADALPVALAAGETVTLRVRAKARGAISARAEDGRRTEVSIDGGPWVESERVEPGEHDVAVRAPGASPVRVSLGQVPDERRRTAPLPALPDEAIAGLPELPVLTAASPAALDLAAGEARTYRLTVAEPAAHRFESTGLLATQGTVRTRILPDYAAAEQNGVGRNFLVATYLREGDYQVTVRALGRSAGHLGLRLVRAEIRDGGRLGVGVPAHAALPADVGVAWRFRIAEAGEYVLRSFGPGREFRMRLEDADGWPLVEPEVQSPITYRFLPGEYRLVGLPEGDATTRLTTLERVDAPVARKGHGPFPLGLETSATHTWWEPAEEGAARAPDRWTFVVPAPADLTVEADAEMTGTLTCDGVEVGRLVAGRPFAGRVGPAACELALVNARRNSGVDYTVRAWTHQLVAGVTRTVRAPVRVPVSVGAEQLVDLASMGGVDVRARLYDATGALVAADDDRPEDWNFALLRRLAPGSYTLRVDPVGGPQADCAIAMRVAGESTEAALPLGETRTFVPGDVVRTFPVAPPADGLLAVAARSTENVGLAVEASDGKGWRTLDSRAGNRVRVEVRLGAPGLTYRVRLWSLDRRGVEATLRADAGSPKRPPEGALRAGVALGGEGAIAVPLDRPGTFSLATTQGLRVCPAPGDACREPDGATVSGDAVWVTGPVGAKVQARRVVVAGEAVRVRVGRPATVDLDAKGPVVAWPVADGGQPGVRVVEAGEAGTPSGGMAVAEGRALAVSLTAKRPTAIAWSADGEAEEVRLARAAFPPIAPEPAAWGDFAGRLEPGAAKAYALPDGARTVRVTLDAGLVAVAGEGDAATEVAWAAAAPLSRTVPGAPGRLTLLNPTGEAASFTVEVSHGGEPLRLATGVPVERIARAAGETRVEVPAEAGVLHVRGGHATLVRADGTVARGPDLPLDGRPGALVVRHAPGPWLAWIDRPGEEDRALWGKATPSPAPTPVAFPAEVPLAGVAQRLAIDAPAAGLVRVRAAGPMVALVRRGQGPYEARLVDGALDVAVPAAGPVEIALRGVAGAGLSGAASVSFDRATDLGEGLGPEVVVPPGGARVFRFVTDREAPVGVGVRSDSAAVDAVVYDADGREVGRGVAWMRTLPKGAWLLAVTVPADAAPARARPAVVGLVPPDTGPPADVVRSYLVAAGLLPPDDASPDAPEAE
ncbi:MAG: hypothetical protein ACOZNI_34660 [Myxococcota bacterium]